MIAGEVPAPSLALGNRDVIRRHLAAVAFGASEPGLAGKMLEYVDPKGNIKEEAVHALITGIREQFYFAVNLAVQAWANDVLPAANVDAGDLSRYLSELPDKVRDAIERTARQVKEMRIALDLYATELKGGRAAYRAGELVARLLGMESEKSKVSNNADDRSSGYPLRRFAEFGILPGYEFPSKPATLRLLGDPHEDEPINTARRLGINQFQPDAQVYARTGRWKVRGIDNSSPWNPQSDDPGWQYRVCKGCDLRYIADQPRCPRCGLDEPGRTYSAMEYAGFLATRDEGPILDEEERYASKNLVQLHPQWDGDIVGRWTVGPGWGLRLCRGETVQWLNEGRVPSPKQLQDGIPVIHDKAKGFYICPSCWRMLTVPETVAQQTTGRQKTANGTSKNDPYGHAEGCAHAGAPPSPLSIVTSDAVEVLKLVVPVPEDPHSNNVDIDYWGYSLGYALRSGMSRYFALSDRDIEFVFEGLWNTTIGGESTHIAVLTFIDPSLGGSGYLPRIAEAFDRVAARAVEHLDHPDCESACYRCLKSYDNQRFHEFLRWPRIMGDLESLAGSPVVSRPSQTGDINDPKPWLEAYAAGVGSPLELKFLRLFESRGIRVEKQVPVSPDDADRPISVADFAIPEKRIAIYIDGAAFHKGSNARRDRFIREKLRSGTMPWRVVELRAPDLSRPENIAEQLK
jgi:very-short-patch-repair endonuclease